MVIAETADKEKQQKLVSSMKHIAWTSHEHDRFEVPSVPAPGGSVGVPNCDPIAPGQSAFDPSDRSQYPANWVFKIPGP